VKKEREGGGGRKKEKKKGVAKPTNLICFIFDSGIRVDGLQTQVAMVLDSKGYSHHIVWWRSLGCGHHLCCQRYHRCSVRRVRRRFHSLRHANSWNYESFSFKKKELPKKNGEQSHRSRVSAEFVSNAFSTVPFLRSYGITNIL